MKDLGSAEVRGCLHSVSRAGTLWPEAASSQFFRAAHDITLDDYRDFHFWQMISALISVDDRQVKR